MSQRQRASRHVRTSLCVCLVLRVQSSKDKQSCQKKSTSEARFLARQRITKLASGHIRRCSSKFRVCGRVGYSKWSYGASRIFSRSQEGKNGEDPVSGSDRGLPTFIEGSSNPKRPHRRELPSLVSYSSIPHDFFAPFLSANREYATVTTAVIEKTSKSRTKLHVPLQNNPQPRQLNAAERVWLSGEDDYTTAQTQHGIPRPRFDWRERAQSRARPSIQPEDENDFQRFRRIKPEDTCVEEGQPFFSEIQAYKKRFLPLIKMEQAVEEDLIKCRLADWSLQRLQEEGYCLTGLTGYWLDETRFGRPVAAFTHGPGITLPNHLLFNGTQVILSRVDPLKEPSERGNVISNTATHLKVCFDKGFDVADGSWRIDMGSSNIAYERMRAAIGMLNFDPQMHEDNFHNSPKQEVILQGTHLRDVLLKSFSPTSGHSDEHNPLQEPDDPQYASHERLEHPSRLTGDQCGAFKDDMRVQSWAKRHQQLTPIAVEGDPVLQGLNASQTRAAAMMIRERISLVQGPPGTGKTRTIIETIKLLKAHFEVVHSLLVCTYTNVAVDNLVEGLAKTGLKPLRIGSDGKVRLSLEEYTLEHQFDIHRLKPEYDRVVEQLKKVRQEVYDFTRTMKEKRRKLDKLEDPVKIVRAKGRLDKMDEHLQTFARRANALNSRKHALQQKITRDIILKSDVVCTTCIASSSPSLNVVDFPVVFLDEASMSTEPASLIPLMKGCRHLALIGDHKQLPPVITSREAQAGGFGISLFERLTEEGDVPSIMLDTQYRMHPGISRFPSAEFYNFSLRDGTVNALGAIAPNLLPPVSSHLVARTDESGHRPPVIFLDHQGPEALKNRSRVNWTDAYIVCSVIEDLLLNNQELRGEHIGVIAPYVSQISLLNRLLNQQEKMKERFIATLGVERAVEIANIEVKTVDGFEGREKEIMIFSTVRNNPEGHIGFLADRRRLNVGLTRAKRALFVIGSMNTLAKGKYGRDGSDQPGHGVVRVGKGGEAWRRYTEYLSEQNLVLRLRGQSLREALHATSATQAHSLYY